MTDRHKGDDEPATKDAKKGTAFPVFWGAPRLFRLDYILQKETVDLLGKPALNGGLIGHALPLHSLRDLEEARYVGAQNQIAFVAEFL